MGALSVFIPAGEHAGSGTLTTAADDTSGGLEAVTDAGSTVLTLSRRPPASLLSLTGLSHPRYRLMEGIAHGHH